MELDEMKLAWQALDRRLEQQHALNVRMFKDGRLDRLRRGLRPLVWGQAAQIALGIGVMLWGVAFWSTHTHIWQALACGITVQAFGILTIVFSARVLSLVQGIDYAAPVLEIQRRLATLRAWRIRVEAPVFAVLGSLIWIPVMLMLIQYDWDRMGAADWWARFPGLVPWMTFCGVVSLAVVGSAYGLIRWAGHRRWLENNFAGRSVQKAESVLAELKRFESE
ncbi:hypothetical protein B0E46_06330 [Rhodanobacter sp. B04]|nr:hypothetical protein B0E46_06330 [Rhodanobacter sp. B04]